MRRLSDKVFFRGRHSWSEATAQVTFIKDLRYISVGPVQENYLLKCYTSSNFYSSFVL